LNVGKVEGLKGEGETVYGRDIKSAFNGLRKEEMKELLMDYPELQEWIDQLLMPRTCNINGEQTRSFQPLLYTDDVNSIRAGPESTMDR